MLVVVVILLPCHHHHHTTAPTHHHYTRTPHHAAPPHLPPTAYRYPTYLPRLHACHHHLPLLHYTLPPPAFTTQRDCVAHMNGDQWRARYRRIPTRGAPRSPPAALKRSRLTVGLS